MRIRQVSEDLCLFPLLHRTGLVSRRFQRYNLAAVSLSETMPLVNSCEAFGHAFGGLIVAFELLRLLLDDH